jgi:hypothetical protein
MSSARTLRTVTNLRAAVARPSPRCLRASIAPRSFRRHSSGIPNEAELFKKPGYVHEGRPGLPWMQLALGSAFIGVVGWNMVSFCFLDARLQPLESLHRADRLQESELMRGA